MVEGLGIEPKPFPTSTSADGLRALGTVQPLHHLPLLYVKDPFFNL